MIVLKLYKDQLNDDIIMMSLLSFLFLCLFAKGQNSAAKGNKVLGYYIFTSVCRSVQICVCKLIQAEQMLQYQNHENDLPKIQCHFLRHSMGDRILQFLSVCVCVLLLQLITADFYETWCKCWVKT